MTRTRKRKRNYKAEYARRVKGTAKGSKERQRARGQARAEPVRREREARKFGIAGAALTRLRAQALNHVLAQLGAVKTRSRPNLETIRRGLRLLHSESLRSILEMHGDDYRMLARIDYEEVAAVLSENPDDWDERNPFWYH